MFYPTLLPIANQPLSSNGSTPTAGPAGAPLAIPCPTLTPRAKPQKVTDLRADDIQAVIGIGDSVMAGFAANGIQNQQYVSLNTFQEARGLSFAMGGDQGVVTVPNLLHFYSPRLYGSSIGDQLVTICFGDFCPVGQYQPSIDQLNGAQSGARSMDLNHELDYLLGQLADAYKKNYIAVDDWKLLTFFIGSNDLCHACAVNTSLPGPFIVDVQNAIERIRNNIPYVLIQVVGLLRIDEIFLDTQAYPTYCRPFKQSNFVLHDHECMCAHSAANLSIMASLQPQFNAALQSVVDYYRSPLYSNDTFTIVYRPLSVNIQSFPIQAISNVDCFHPSALAHSWFSKILWYT
ncbi:hypothetical protein DM01DRAFT_297161 [Hesseltinella vesiculosa]|uniref:SGNH hydrolase n=1 Tax=Hesseltinella vesiculosa TaxID=101127 RepID=A0A1X2G5R0_9FUNG|nr:hypothetical protein DM01DRAFT_297161 [Hesseltinella vesiculosa]